jgi:hypothetical protein
MSTATYLDLLQLAAGELNLVALGANLSANAALAQRMLDRLTTMVDSWNLEPLLVPWYDQYIFNLKSGQQSYLIGPNAPDWNAPRPIRLDQEATHLLLTNPVAVGAGLPGYYPDSVQTNGIPAGGAPYSASANGVYLGSYPLSILINSLGPGSIASSVTSPIRIPLAVLTVQQWSSISLPSLQNTFPQGCYLDRSVITGTSSLGAYTASRISVWGIPTVVNQMEFFYWHALTVGNLTDNVNAAPGYFRAMFLNLALEIAPSLGITPNDITVKNAADSLGAIKELNAPDMAMRPDRGMPSPGTSGWITKAQFLSGSW